MLCGLCRFSADTNNKVKVAIVKDIRSQPGCEFDDRLVCRTQKIFSLLYTIILSESISSCSASLRKLKTKQFGTKRGQNRVCRGTGKMEEV